MIIVAVGEFSALAESNINAYTRHFKRFARQIMRRQNQGVAPQKDVEVTQQRQNWGCDQNQLAAIAHSRDCMSALRMWESNWHPLALGAAIQMSCLWQDVCRNGRDAAVWVEVSVVDGDVGLGVAVAWLSGAGDRVCDAD